MAGRTGWRTIAFIRTETVMRRSRSEWCSCFPKARKKTAPCGAATRRGALPRPWSTAAAPIAMPTAAPVVALDGAPTIEAASPVRAALEFAPPVEVAPESAAALEAVAAERAARPEAGPGLRERAAAEDRAIAHDPARAVTLD